MGGGSWDSKSYSSARSTRRTKGIDDFDYSRTADRIHKNLDPKRILGKPYGKLESRDSKEHPESTAIFVAFDVTGSNINRARVAQAKLPNLMDMLQKHLKNPQILIAANDDFRVEPDQCVQISDFESDNRVDEHLRNLMLVGNGGGNSGESYDLLLYAAARLTVLDCMEKRGKKGYLFMYADEPLMEQVRKDQVNHVFGQGLQGNIPIEEIIAEARKLYNVFLVSTVRPEWGAEKQYPQLFGKESVIILQDPDMICELIASVVSFNEGAHADTIVKDMVALGTDLNDAKSIVKTAAAFVVEPKLLRSGTGR